MPSKICYQTWSLGSGLGDHNILIGYCIEPPIEVLKQVLLTHDVYYYRDLYRPIDYNFPNNVMGLIINETKAPKGTIITGKFKDLNCNKALTKNKRSKETILDSLKECKKWSINPANIEQQKKCWEQIDEIIKMINEIL